MSHANQHSNKVDRARLRQWQKKANGLVDAKDKAEEDILVSIYEMEQEGLSYAAIAGMFVCSPSGIAKKARQGEKILAARRGDSTT